MSGQFNLEAPVFSRGLEGRVLKAATDAATTLTAAESIESIVTMTPTAARNITTATAALILAELTEGYRVGSTFELTVVNLAGATYAATLVGGTGVTITGVAAVSAATSGTFVGYIASTSAITFYRK